MAVSSNDNCGLMSNCCTWLKTAPSSGSPEHKRSPLKVCPGEGHENDERDGTSFQQRKAEKVKVVHPREEKAPRKPCCSLSVLEGAYKKDGDF